MQSKLNSRNSASRMGTSCYANCGYVPVWHAHALCCSRYRWFRVVDLRFGPCTGRRGGARVHRRNDDTNHEEAAGRHGERTQAVSRRRGLPSSSQASRWPCQDQPLLCSQGASRRHRGERGCESISSFPTHFLCLNTVCAGTCHALLSLSLSLTVLLAAASPDEGADPFISGMKNRPLLPRRSNTHPQQRRDSSAACACLCQNRKPRPNPSQRRKAIYDMEALVAGTVRTRATGGMERRAHPRFVEPLSLQLTCGVHTQGIRCRTFHEYMVKYIAKRHPGESTPEIRLHDVLVAMSIRSLVHVRPHRLQTRTRIDSCSHGHKPIMCAPSHQVFGSVAVLIDTHDVVRFPPQVNKPQLQQQQTPDTITNPVHTHGS